LFRKQIRRGGPVTVTHPDVTRFFMTIPEAVQLVIQASALSEGGDVFVLDMGKPVQILKLAQTMIQLMGKSIKSDENPDGDIEIEYSGLRPGEKLYEELLIGDNCIGTDHAMITRAMEKSLTKEKLREFLSRLENAMSNYDLEDLVKTLQQSVEEYTPSEDIYDPTRPPRSERTTKVHDLFG
jgi:FlaA1/EpsC-like NDP-sugar epimerase